MVQRDKLRKDEHQVIVSVSVDDKQLFYRCTVPDSPHGDLQGVRCRLGSCWMKPVGWCCEKDGILLRGWHFYLRECGLGSLRKIGRSSDAVHIQK